MLIDEVDITLKGGHGGPGRVSFRPPPMKGPDGGNGGKGGDVFLKVVSDITLLSQFSARKEFSAGDGESGGRNRKSGSKGKDLVICLPVGTTLIDLVTNEKKELLKADEILLICKGGKGGRGNYEFKSSRNTTPKIAQPGLDGEGKKFKLILKLIADYGLIGLPNAGKSSLLNELTNAKAKTAGYAFTTLEPNLGSLNGKIIADIPGLIEGASRGKGLGDKFLKHIEKVKLLLHCISAQSPDVVKDYEVIAGELKDYDIKLARKKEIILLTKTDLADKKDIEKQVKILKKFKKQILPVSIHDWDSVERLKKLLDNK